MEKSLCQIGAFFYIENSSHIQKIYINDIDFQLDKEYSVPKRKYYLQR